MKMHFFAGLAGVLIAAAPAATLAQSGSNEGSQPNQDQNQSAPESPNNEDGTQAWDVNERTSQDGSSASNPSDAQQRSADQQRSQQDSDAQQANEQQADQQQAQQQESRQREARQQEAQQQQADRNQSSQQNAQFTEQERTAPWRFVQRDGNWWYRTPMNTWMVQRNNQWQPLRRSAGYRGDQNAYGGQAYGNRGVSSAQYQQPYSSQPRYSDGVQRTAYNQQGSSYNGQHPSVGTTEWMCIDGRMRQVTVVSVSSPGQSGQSPTPADQGQSQGYQANNSNAQSNQTDSQASTQGLTPPPVPQPNSNNAAQAQNQDLPEAPSRDRLMQYANQPQGAGSQQGQRTTVQKPITSGESYQAPADPRPVSPESDFQSRNPASPADSGTGTYGRPDTPDSYRQDDLLGGPSDGLDSTDSFGGDAAPERR
ncbi:hypothetical protein [Botrimarina sp.]|uniref:hypothetical protein n=1 Tax=Botrimarina sp. TaxID=2795802 RepID=UPI0032EE6130